MSDELSLENLHTIVFDFDGIFTDNKVYVNQQGQEFVRCDRADGLGFNILRNYIEANELKLSFFVLSKEKNPVVTARCEKLNLSCYQGCDNKLHFLKSYLSSNSLSSSGLCYVGNDLNDLPAIMLAGVSIAPSDAHPIIKQYADHVLPNKGGNSFVRSVIEALLDINSLEIGSLLKIIQ